LKGEDKDMAIDQSPLSTHTMEQMEAIEQDPGVPDEAEIGGIVTIVEVIGPEDDDGMRSRGFRVRSNLPPHVTIGVLEEAKMIQLGTLQGG
jgi:hypothetical protein